MKPAHGSTQMEPGPAVGRSRGRTHLRGRLLLVFRQLLLLRCPARRPARLLLGGPCAVGTGSGIRSSACSWHGAGQQGSGAGSRHVARQAAPAAGTWLGKRSCQPALRPRCFRCPRSAPPRPPRSPLPLNSNFSCRTALARCGGRGRRFSSGFSSGVPTHQASLNTICTQGPEGRRQVGSRGR